MTRFRDLIDRYFGILEGAISIALCFFALHAWTEWKQDPAAFDKHGMKPTLCCMHRECTRCGEPDFD